MTGSLVNIVGGEDYIATANGNRFTAAVGGAGQTLVAVNLFSTAIATFQPILCLYNPIANKNNLAVRRLWGGVTGDPASATATGALLLVVGSGQTISNATATGATNNNVIGSATTATGIIVLNATLTGAAGNAVYLRPMQSSIIPTAEGGTATPVSGSVLMEHVGGSIILPPGAYLAVANGISNTTGIVVAGIEWNEIPIVKS